MANGLTTATKEDQVIQARRVNRADTRRARECVGWSIGRGYESDYLEGISVSDGLRYRQWLRYFSSQQIENVMSSILKRGRDCRGRGDLKWRWRLV